MNLRNLIILLGVLAAYAVVPTGASRAETLHVSPSGAGDTCAAQRPCTLSQGLRGARRGDVIQLGPGRYRSRVELQHDGVTLRGAPGHASTLLWPGGSSKHVLAIKANDLLIDGLVIDGEANVDPNSEAGKGHGLVRFYSSKNIILRDNKISNSRGTLISVGGSVPGAKISQVRIFNNSLTGAGYGKEWGEAIYICSNKSQTKSCTDVEIAGNEIKDFADNGIDLKASSQSVHIHHNIIEHQVVRTDTGNHGTIVTQGSDHLIEHNIIRRADGGTSVLNLASQSGIVVRGNLMDKVMGETLIRTRTRGNGAKTLITGNWVCETNTKRLKVDGGFTIKGNYGLDLPLTEDCAVTERRLLAAREALIGGSSLPPPPPPPETIELELGQQATCPGPVTVTGLPGTEHYTIHCGQETL